MALVVPGSGTAGAGIASEQAAAHQIVQQIVAEGAAVQQAVSQEDATQAKVASLAAQVAATKARRAAYRRAENRAGRTLERLAVHTYMTGEDAAGVSSMFGGGNASAIVARTEYSRVAEGDLGAALDTYRTDERQTHAETAALEAQQAQASAAAAQLASAAQQAQAALAHDTVLLDQVKGKIAILQAAQAAQARQAAARQAALAAQQAQRRLAPVPPRAQVVAAPAAPAPAPTAAPPAAQTVTSSGYANPLRSVSGLSPERIDQGVDYQGYGPLYAIGTGVVLNTVNGGWPGGTFITYRLTAGPATGLVVYSAEDIQPAVQVGQRVTATTVIGTLYEGPDGIETGWADPAGTGYTMAYSSGQFSGSNSTAFGANFSQLLGVLGAPAGILQNNPPTGTLPAGWPSW